MRRAVDLDRQIGKKVMELRISNGWSRSQLAEKIDITHQQLLKNEHGLNRMPPDRLSKLASVFNVTISTLFNEELDPIPTTRPRLNREALKIFNGLAHKQQMAVLNLMREMQWK